MASKQFPVPFPSKGISEEYGFSYQEELTSRDERNMRVRDPKTGRLRGAQRSGMDIHGNLDDQVNGANKIQDVFQIVEATSSQEYAPGINATINWSNRENNPDDDVIGPVKEDEVVKQIVDADGVIYTAYTRGIMTVATTDGGEVSTFSLPGAFNPNNNLGATLLVDFDVDYNGTIFMMYTFYLYRDDPPNFTNATNIRMYVLPRDAFGKYHTDNLLYWEFARPSNTAIFGTSNQTQMVGTGIMCRIEGADDNNPGVPAIYIGCTFRWNRDYLPAHDDSWSITSSTANGKPACLLRLTNYEPLNADVPDNADLELVYGFRVPIAPETGFSDRATEATPTNNPRNRNFGLNISNCWHVTNCNIQDVDGHAIAFSLTNYRSDQTIGSLAGDDRPWWSLTLLLQYTGAAWDIQEDAFVGVLQDGWANCRYGAMSITTMELDTGAGYYLIPLKSVPASGFSVAPWKGPAPDETLALTGEPITDRQEIFQITSAPTNGDILTFKGPQRNDPTTLGTLAISFVNSATALTIASATNRVNITIGLTASAYSGHTDVWMWGRTIIDAICKARTTDTPGGISNYDDLGPDIWVSDDNTFSTADQKIFCTHPDIFQQLSSTSYWRVDGTWTNAADATNNDWFTPTSTYMSEVAYNSGQIDETTQTFVTELTPKGHRFDQADAVLNKIRFDVFPDSEGAVPLPWNVDSFDADLAFKDFLIIADDYATSGTINYFDVNLQSPVMSVHPEVTRPVELEDDDFGYEVYVATANGGVGLFYASLYNVTLRDLSVDVTPVRELHTMCISNNQLKKYSAAGYLNPDGYDRLDTSTNYFQTAVGFEKAYIADGVAYWEYDPKDDATNPAGKMQRLVGTALAPVPPRCALIETWRDRLVIARDPYDPGRWHMSAVGDPKNWNFAPSVLTAGDAASSTNTQAGRAPDIINSLVPWTDDTMLFGGDSTIWLLNGDPLSSSAVFDLVSDEIGMAFGRPWCKDPEGGLWFMSNGTGLFYMQRGAQPVRISMGRIEAQLRGIDLSTHYIRLAWNQVDEGVHIFQMPFGAGGTIVDHWFFEVHSQAFHKDVFGAAADLIQPTAACRINGDSPNDRTLLIGCEDGRLRVLPSSFTSSIKSDRKTLTTNVAIDSYTTIGPLINSPYQAASQMTEFGAVLGSSLDGCRFEFFSTDDPAVLGDPVAVGNLRPGRNDRHLVRLSGDHLFLRLRNASVEEAWAWEGGYGTMSYGGDLRR